MDNSDKIKVNLHLLIQQKFSENSALCRMLQMGVVVQRRILWPLCSLEACAAAAAKSRACREVKNMTVA